MSSDTEAATAATCTWAITILEEGFKPGSRKHFSANYLNSVRLALRQYAQQVQKSYKHSNPTPTYILIEAIEDEILGPGRDKTIEKIASSPQQFSEFEQGVGNTLHALARYSQQYSNNVPAPSSRPISPVVY